MATGAALSVSIREKRFPGAEPLFRDLALSLAPGETVVLLGPSGVGKSTLLRLVAGVDRGFAGTVAIDGSPPAKAPPPGFVFQDARLLPWLTAEGNVRAAAPSVSAARARDLLAAVGLAGQEDALPDALSGGMQRRVALARALAPRPGLLLLDEPFVSLDAALADEMRAVLLRLAAAEGPTVLLATHAPRDAARLADRVLLLAGRPAQVVATLAPIPPPGARSAEDVARIEAEFTRLCAVHLPPAMP